jgi:hypothetical protein
VLQPHLADEHLLHSHSGGCHLVRPNGVVSLGGREPGFEFRVVQIAGGDDPGVELLILDKVADGAGGIMPLAAEQAEASEVRVHAADVARVFNAGE